MIEYKDIIYCFCHNIGHELDQNCKKHHSSLNVNNMMIKIQPMFLTKIRKLY